MNNLNPNTFTLDYLKVLYADSMIDLNLARQQLAAAAKENARLKSDLAKLNQCLDAKAEKSPASSPAPSCS